MKDQQNNRKLELYVSRGVLLTVFLIGIFCCIAELFLYIYITKSFAYSSIIWPGFILILGSFLLFFRKIVLVNKDAKFEGVFKRKSIKDIESIDCSGFWVFK